jgi:UDP-N-acetyl-D-glucosamine dehydrogenase
VKPPDLNRHIHHPSIGAFMKTTALLRRRILSQEATVAVVGQGYVGLSLACAAADEGFSVTGIDIDKVRIADLKKEILSVPGVSPAAFETAVESGRIEFAVEASSVSDADIICICVPTPIRDNGPDLSFVENACRQVAEHLKAGSLVILESTTYPGTTEGPVKDALESSGLSATKEFLLAYSPERIDPGNDEHQFQQVPRIVGGLTPEATGVAGLFYGQLVEKVFEVSTCRAAELAKLLENTFRHVNIGLVNEMAMICNEIEVDVWEVIEAAATKPFGFMPFYPGPGVGGHCIPVDPAYLAWQVRRDAGYQYRILEQAQDVNARMPAYVASRIADVLNDAGKPMKDSRVLVLGAAYKPDVGDLRESPAIRVMEMLKKRGAEVSFHDPYVESVALNGSILQRKELSKRLLASSDCVAFLTPHAAYDLDWLAEHAPLIFDARNAFADRSYDNVIRL